MEWKESSPGRWTRALDATDRFMEIVCLATQKQGREHWTINVSARLDRPLDRLTCRERLCNAWMHLRYQHPFLAAELKEHEFVYCTPDAQALERWLSDTVFAEAQASLDDLLAGAQPRSQASLHYSESSHEVIVRIHHWLVDGRGAIALLNNLLGHLAAGLQAPSFGDEKDRLAPSFVEAAAFPKAASETAQAYANKMIADFVGSLPSIGLPYKKSQASTIGGGRRRWYDLPDTAPALVNACRQRGISVTAAVHAAMVVATQEQKTPFAAAHNYVSVGSFDYRDHLVGEYRERSRWPLGMYMLGVPIALPAADFDTHARALYRFYHQPLDRGATDLFDAYNAYVPQMASVLSQPVPEGIPPPTQPQLSSVGNLDARVQCERTGAFPLRVEHIELAVDQLTPGLLMYQWSWQGTFFLSACFNPDFHDDATVDAFLQRTVQLLLLNLDITRPTSATNGVH